MGICSSTSVATVKLILQNGELKEFANPARVSDALKRNPSCFICNSDDMDFNKVISAMNEDEELQLGELYFALPLSWLNSPLCAEDMASLAIRASLALKMNNGNGDKCICDYLMPWCGIRRINDQIMFASKREEEYGSSEIMLDFGGGDRCVGGCDVGFVVKERDCGRRERISTKLTTILEE